MIHVQAALHAFGSICGVDRQEDQMKLDGQAEEYLKRLVYTTAANSSKLTPSVSSNSFLVCPFILAYGSGLLSWVFFFWPYCFPGSSSINSATRPGYTDSCK